MKIASAGLSSRYTVIAATFIAALLTMHWVGVFITQGSNIGLNNLAAAFDLDREWNIPTFANSFLLAMCGLFSVVHANNAKKRLQQAGWLISAALFTYLAIDELFILHEQLAEPMRQLLNIGNANPLYHAWVVPAFGVIALIFATIIFIHSYYKQLRVFNGLLQRIAILAIGVVCLEILGTFVYSNTVVYRLFMVSSEEIFELIMAANMLHYLAIKTKPSHR